MQIPKLCFWLRMLVVRSSLERELRGSCVEKNSRSTEDVMLLPLLRNASQLATPSFLEIGAFDGETGSQTWLVEKCLGWRGLLIEANPLTFRKLQSASRSTGTVRKHAAVCGGNRTTVNMREGGGTASSLLGINKGFVRRSVHNSPIREVPCAPLPRLMADAGLSTARASIAFLSLDVEGAEEMVLQTVDLNAFPFAVVLVEMAGRDAGKDQRVRDMLTKRAGLMLLSKPRALSRGSQNEIYGLGELKRASRVGRF